MFVGAACADARAHRRSNGGAHSDDRPYTDGGASPYGYAGEPRASRSRVRGIVDPTNFGWPRKVEGLNGLVTIPSKPQRIITASIGHDEMTLALVPRDRLVGVGGVTKNATYSNVASLRPGHSRDLPRPGDHRRPVPGRHRHQPVLPGGGGRGPVEHRHPGRPDRAEARHGGQRQQHPVHGLHIRRGGARHRVRDRRCETGTTPSLP